MVFLFFSKESQTLAEKDIDVKGNKLKTDSSKK